MPIRNRKDVVARRRTVALSVSIDDLHQRQDACWIVVAETGPQAATGASPSVYVDLLRASYETVKLLL
jgi:hypothetical protein